MEIIINSNIKCACYVRVGSIEQLNGQLEDVHIPGKMGKNRKDVLIYCQEDPNNFEVNYQRDRLIRFAYDKGFYIKGIFQDIGSGLDFNRKSLTALLAAISERHVDYVLVRDIDQISKNYIIKKIGENNTKVFYADRDTFA